jgi:hypothetical protein
MNGSWCPWSIPVLLRSDHLTHLNTQPPWEQRRWRKSFLKAKQYRQPQLRQPMTCLQPVPATRHTNPGTFIHQLHTRLPPTGLDLSGPITSLQRPLPGLVPERQNAKTPFARQTHHRVCRQGEACLHIEWGRQRTHYPKTCWHRNTNQITSWHINTAFSDQDYTLTLHLLSINLRGGTMWEPSMGYSHRLPIATEVTLTQIGIEATASYQDDTDKLACTVASSVFTWVRLKAANETKRISSVS